MHRCRSRLIPFVKLPTADGDIGNGKVEGGLAVPISIATGGPVTVVLGPELDLLADADGDGHHPALVNLVNVAGPIAPGLTLGRRNLDDDQFRSGGHGDPGLGRRRACLARRANGSSSTWAPISG